MSQALRDTLANGEYKVDADAVARAMITRARALRVARRGSDCSQVLVAPDRIEVRRVGGREPQPFPVQRTA
jgi:Anti-sigma-28 factor, FlgM